MALLDGSGGGIFGEPSFGPRPSRSHHGGAPRQRSGYEYPPGTSPTQIMQDRDAMRDAEFIMKYNQSVEEHRQRQQAQEEAEQDRRTKLTQDQAYRQEQEDRRQEGLAERRQRDESSAHEQSWRIQQARQGGYERQYGTLSREDSAYQQQILAQAKAELADVEKQLAPPKLDQKADQAKGMLDQAHNVLKTMKDFQPAALTELSKGNSYFRQPAVAMLYTLAANNQAAGNPANLALESAYKTLQAQYKPATTMDPAARAELEHRRDALRFAMDGGWSQSPEHTSRAKKMAELQKLIDTDPAVAEANIFKTLYHGTDQDHGTDQAKSAQNTAQDILGTIKGGKQYGVPQGTSAGTITTEHGTMAVPRSLEYGGPGVNTAANTQGGGPDQSANQAILDKMFDRFNVDPSHRVMGNDTSTTVSRNPRQYEDITNQQTPTMPGSGPGHQQAPKPPTGMSNPANLLPHIAASSSLFEGPHKDKILQRLSAMGPDDRDNFLGMVSQRHGIPKEVLGMTVQNLMGTGSGG